MAESHGDQSSSFGMQNELRDTNGTLKQSDKPDNSEGSCKTQPTGNSENLEDLLLTLHKQLSDSDWLKKNTAEKWVEENPELAKEYMEAAKKS